MKKNKINQIKNIIFATMFLILTIVLVTNMTANRAIASNTTLSSYEKDLIKKYGWGGNHVKRWPDGIVYVYNQTEYNGLSEIIKEINRIIGGNTIFQLSKDKKESNVIFQTSAFLEYASMSEWRWDGYRLKEWKVLIDPQSIRRYRDTYRDKLFLSIFLKIAGFNVNEYIDWWDLKFIFIDKEVRDMLKALYKVPPGYNLLTGKN